MNKILIIDDDRELCALIKRSVQAENIEADFCNTGKEGLQKLREQEYQLVVLDVMMPGMDGFETLEEIRKENSLPILMFTSKNDSISKVRGLRAGADDYLTKPFDMDELIARIASLIRRYTRFNHQAGAVQKLDFDGLQIDLENRSVTTSNGTFELPPKEFDLLLYCAKHQGKILTKQQIYEEVWGEEYFYDDSNIMAIISRLRKKFGEVELTPEELEEIRKREERKDRLHQNYLKRKASGAQKRYEDKIKKRKKAEIEAKKAAIRAEDIAKGVFVPVSSLPQKEPMKGVQTA